jgi:hypothetical protein
VQGPVKKYFPLNKRKNNPRIPRDFGLNKTLFYFMASNFCYQFFIQPRGWNLFLEENLLQKRIFELYDSEKIFLLVPLQVSPPVGEKSG